MKKIIIISGIAILMTAALLSMTILQDSSPDKKKAKEENIKKEEKHSCCSSENETGEIKDNSIYQLAAEWTNQDGKKIAFSEFRGKRVVFTMFFASCTYACPILVEDMKRIESKIPADELKNYSFVLISIDPERDTPEKLKDFAKIKNIDFTRWTLLTGTEDDVMDLAAVAGFKYKKEKDGQFSHSNIINIMNEEGEIIFQHLGLNQDITLATNYLQNE